MRLLTLACLVALVLMTRVQAQTAPAASSSVGIQPVPSPAQQLRAARGSLMRAAMVQQPTQPGQQGSVVVAQVAQASLFAVAPPEPRVLRKHDIVQIIVREESSFSSEGNTDLKKEAPSRPRSTTC
jgi:flagellar basal body L-ring protein FlgH